ncbi:F167 [Hirschfeldia incana]|nr:F167 [Hirschfeldia incana]
MSSSDPKTENATHSKPLMNEPPSEKLGDSSPELGDSNSSEKLGDSSPVWKDPVESKSPNEEEKRDCGFCVFMKEGGCRESFTAWEVCVEEAEKNKEDIKTKCMEVTSTLHKCMDAHSDYYQPILAAERAAAEQVKKEFEAAAEKNKVEKEEEEISEEEVAARKQAQG